MTPEQEREEALRQIKHHVAAAARAEWTHKRVQHEEAIRYLCDRFGIASPLAPLPERPPTYEVIKEVIRDLGFADALAMFWEKHQRQAEAPQDYAKAYHNMRRLAVAALVGHDRASVWIPVRVPCGSEMKFEKVLPAKPKGERDFLSTKRYSK